MLFNSYQFLVFYPLVFFLFWFLLKKSVKYQNILLLVASYYFYGLWDYRFLGLIILTTIVDYNLGIAMHRTQQSPNRKWLLGLSLFLNLGLLGFFKYFNFFINSFADLLTMFGLQANLPSLSVILPVGISFYTFQSLSYTIDIYKKEIEPSRDFLSFATFVAFFPQLVAGPIERAAQLLPQFYVPKQFNYDRALNGLRQVLWGFFKKVVIADNCSVFVNSIFGNYQEASSGMLVLGAVLFAFQIYGDFSGYSDIAIGTARILDFNLMQNFAFPYFSRDIAEFWRRWHISLSTWFRDYLYFPLGGSKGSLAHKVRNTFIIFLVSGFWHGANWTFIAWGALNAVYFLPLLLTGRNRHNLHIVAHDREWPGFKAIAEILYTFSITCIAWVFFRSVSIKDSMAYLAGVFNNRHLPFWSNPDLQVSNLGWLAVYLFILLSFEWMNRRNHYGLEHLRVPAWVRYLIYGTLSLLVIHHFGGEKDFIYFQF